MISFFLGVIIGSLFFSFYDAEVPYNREYVN